MNNIELYVIVLTKFLTASLLLERIIEFFDRIFRILGLSLGFKQTLFRFAGVPISVEQQRKNLLKKVFLIQTAGIGIGIGICFYTRLGLLNELGLLKSSSYAWFDFVLSGVFISGGSEPIHQLINFLKGQKETLKQVAVEKQNRLSVQNVKKFTPPGQTIGIQYRGGLTPEIPGHGLRKANPEYVVLHHSATPITATFEDVVKKEKRLRKNARGSYTLDPSFHSVITFDGKIHNYCRWDSIGWHVARGSVISNLNSLGLCFVGNFQNRGSGRARPSSEQIESGARLLALWRWLYQIPENNIVPHSAVRAGKIVCPGENFPVELVVAKSTQILNSWKENPEILEDLEKFKKQRYIYV